MWYQLESRAETSSSVKIELCSYNIKECHIGQPKALNKRYPQTTRTGLNMLLNVTAGNRISMPSVDKLYLVCLLFVLERKDLIQMSIKSILQLEGTSDCLLRRALKERKKKMEG